MLTLGNSNTSSANPNGSLANSNAFSTAINASLNSLKPLKPSPLFLTLAHITNSSPWHSMHPPSAREYSWAGFSAAPPNPAYLPPAHYYVYPVPAAAPASLEHLNNYSPPQLPFSAQTPPSPRQQWVKAFIQQCNKVLHSLCLSPVEFARHACTLLVNLGYSNTPMTLEV
ncbi:hypothetical protein E4T56_gene6851 [Termitomyces sp. T112]|nr:hypothetical protein E4T56_gene6851 [Termitomyces sp. T112]